MKRLLFILIFVSLIIKQVSSEINSQESPFGVLEFLHWDHSWSNYKYATLADLKKTISLMKEAGVDWVRFDFLWSDIEPEEGKFNFGKYDTIVKELSENNINILGVLDYSTDWASSCGRWNCPPKDNAVFLNYVKEVVKHFKDKVKYWEIWNEPDSGIYWDYQYQDGLKTYARILKEAYLVIKEIDPEAKVLNGGLSNFSSIQRLYDNGLKPYFDILNIHIFESPLNPGSDKRLLSSVKFVYKVMLRNGDEEKRIWITETGCPGINDKKVKSWWMGENPNERQQAEWLKIVFKELLKHPAVDKVFWAFFRDCNQHFKDGVDYFGLIRWDFSRKPSFFTYRQIKKKLQSKQ